MNLDEWLDATNQKLTSDPAEKKRRVRERRRVLEKAGTTAATLRIARHRGRIGNNLLYRLADATKRERNRITISAERAE